MFVEAQHFLSEWPCGGGRGGGCFLVARKFKMLFCNIAPAHLFHVCVCADFSALYFVIILLFSHSDHAVFILSGYFFLLLPRDDDVFVLSVPNL